MSSNNQKPKEENDDDGVDDEIANLNHNRPQETRNTSASSLPSSAESDDGIVEIEMQTPKQQRPVKSKSKKRKKNRISASVVFTSDSYYWTGTWVMLALPLIAIMIAMLALLWKDVEDDLIKSREAWILGWTLVLILGLYMVILPKQVDVRRNGSIGIKTFLLTFNFDDVCRAYPSGFGKTDFVRPRLKFATTFSPPHRLVIQRRHGKLDLDISPSEPDLFMKALEQVVTELEQKKGEASERRVDLEGNHHHPEGSRNNDYETTVDAPAQGTKLDLAEMA